MKILIFCVAILQQPTKTLLASEASVSGFLEEYQPWKIWQLLPATLDVMIYLHTDKIQFLKLQINVGKEDIKRTLLSSLT